MSFFVYVLANKRNETLYIGHTDDLVKRLWQHRNNMMPGFTARYGIKTLIWHEAHETRESAFLRERQIKRWNRAWKLELIEKQNPQWCDLWQEVAN
jgi:putative endonuclease